MRVSKKRQGSNPLLLSGRQVRGARSVPGAAFDGDVKRHLAHQAASRPGRCRCCWRPDVCLAQRFVRYVPVRIMHHFIQAFCTMHHFIEALWILCKQWKNGTCDSITSSQAAAWQQAPNSGGISVALWDPSELTSCFEFRLALLKYIESSAAL